MTLDELSIQEAAIEQSLAGPGFAEELKRRAIDADVPRRWVAVHRGYATLLDGQDELVSLEALKRAVFLLWFGCAEPAFLTGMWSEWDPGAMERTWAALLTHLTGEHTDAELRWMVAYYYAVCSWLFEQAPAPTALAAVVRPLDREAWERAAWAPEQFADRGRLGSYWRSMRRVA
jgi:hypothetical protein